MVSVSRSRSRTPAKVTAPVSTTKSGKGSAAKSVGKVMLF